MADWGTIAMATAGGLNTVANSLDIGGNRMRKKQIEQQKKLTDIQVGANKELADYGMGISKEMFEYTGYGAQRRQMEEAGLNPALMYGHAGAGGSTASASSGSASGGQASDEASMKMAKAQEQGMALQMAKLSSEIAINKAQAKKLDKEGDNLDKDLEVKDVNIKDITQSIKNKEAQEAGQKLQNDYDKIRNYISEKTVNYDIGYIEYMAGQAREQWQMLINNREILEETKEDIIKNYELMNQNIVSDMLLKDKQLKISDAQINKMAQDIMQGWKELQIRDDQGNRDLDIKDKQGNRRLDIDERQGDRRLSNEERSNDIKARYPSLNQLGGGILNEALLTLDKLNPISRGGGWSSN